MSNKDKYGRGSGLKHPIDIYAGNRLKQARQARNLSQQKLAKAVGVKFQQLQKYESAVNRISLSKSYELSRVLEVEHSYFLDEYEPGKILPLPTEPLWWQHLYHELSDTDREAIKSIADIFIKLRKE